MLVSALLIGLAGGMHCGLMCSPLQASITAKQKLSINTLIYQLGRILTYIIIGLLFYTIGESISLIGLQDLFVYLIILYVLYFYVLPKKWRKHKWLHKIETIPFNFFKKLLKGKSPKNNIRVRFLMGMLNGLLPCGLVYMAAANSLLASNVLLNILSMALFGLATVPWLVGGTYIIFKPIQYFNNRSQNLKPVLALTVIIILLYRVAPDLTQHTSNSNSVKENTKEITICRGV